ncbi:MAG: PEGA domain-containing protein [Bacteroidetes bacterium]|nr:PEGA domain-containing protein [Bacteroidota bacterium]
MLRILLAAATLLPLLLPAQTEHPVRLGLLIVECAPDSAVVAINGEIVGTTPFQDSLPVGPYTLTLSSPGYQDRTESITVSVDTIRRFGTRLRPLPGLTVFTIPSHVRLMVDSIAVGETPLIALPLAPGKHTVSLRLDEYRPRDLTVTIDSGAGVVRYVKMVPAFGFLSVHASPSGAEITLDSAAFSAPPGPVKLATGQHTLRIRHPDFPLPVEGTFEIEPGRHTRISNDLSAFSLRAMLFSAAVPGLGQVVDGHLLEGTAQCAAVITAAFAARNAVRNVTIAEHDLSVAQSFYDAAPDEHSALLRREQLLHTRTSVGTARRARALWISAAAALYALVLADAAIDHSFVHWLQIEEVRPVPFVNDRYQIGWSSATMKVPL